MRKLLIAEDDPASRELLTDILENVGYHIVGAEDGQEALRKIEQEIPDLVLLDIQMPKLDGIGVIRQLRQNPRFASLPAIAVTAYAMRGDREKVMDAGFHACITKPIDATTVRQTVEQLLSITETPNRG